MWWTESLGRLELQMTLAQAKSCFHSGQCDNDVEYLVNHPKIKRQLDKLSPELVSECLREYGAWDNEERKDHAQNLRRLIWCAACDIAEESLCRD